jgi:hypothetical protein
MWGDLRFLLSLPTVRMEREGEERTSWTWFRIVLECLDRDKVDWKSLRDRIQMNGV